MRGTRSANASRHRTNASAGGFEGGDGINLRTRQPAIPPGPPIAGGAVAVEQITKRSLVWNPKRRGEETAGQLSTADDGAVEAIRRAFIEAEIPCFISEGDTPTVRVPPDSAIRAKEILQNLRTTGHWSVLTLSTKEGTLTPDLP